MQALKAIALLRVGRHEESATAINAVISSHPGDQATLQACTMYFKENDDCELEWPVATLWCVLVVGVFPLCGVGNVSVV